MLGLATAVVSSIPSIIKLFDSDEREEGVKELTQTVVKEAGSALGVKFNNKNDVVEHLKANPQDAIKLREIDNNHSKAVMSLVIEDRNSAREHNVKIQAAKDWLVRNAGSIIALVTTVSTFGLWCFMLFGDTSKMNNQVLLAINSSLTLSFAYVLSFYFGGSKTEADSKRKV